MKSKKQVLLVNENVAVDKGTQFYIRSSKQKADKFIVEYYFTDCKSKKKKYSEFRTVPEGDNTIKSLGIN